MRLAVAGQVRWQASLVALWAAVLATAISVVYTSHLCRQLYGELSLLEREENSLQVEWGRYLLEQSSWASLSHIEQLAVSKLGMHVPAPGEIVMVRQ